MSRFAFASVNAGVPQELSSEFVEDGSFGDLSLSSHPFHDGTDGRPAPEQSILEPVKDGDWDNYIQDLSRLARGDPLYGGPFTAAEQARASKARAPEKPKNMAVRVLITMLVLAAYVCPAECLASLAASSSILCRLFRPI
jgi:hypothetical protein